MQGKNGFYFATHSYRFYVDFKGLLYFDDGTPFTIANTIKDKKFIAQLYKNLQVNDDGGSYGHVASFWGERNLVRCAVSPVIFTHLNKEANQLYFSLDQKC